MAATASDVSAAKTPLDQPGKEATLAEPRSKQEVSSRAVVSVEPLVPMAQEASVRVPLKCDLGSR